MNQIDIIIPGKNESANIPKLIERIHRSLTTAKIPYSIIYIDDRSEDNSIEILKGLSSKYPLKYFTKQGKQGKAYSIIEGANYSQADYIVMIDADLQYPPEAIPEMVRLLDQHQVVIAHRKHHERLPRKIMHSTFSILFGKLLHGFPYDIQSGLKLFKREILLNIDTASIGGWSMDLPLLLTARELGYSIGEVPVEFDKRTQGQSKIQFFRSSYEIGKNALSLKLHHKNVFPIPPHNSTSMHGAGVIKNKKHLITHTTLPHHTSALETFTNGQKLFIFTLFALLTTFLFLSTQNTLVTIVGFLSAIYFIDVLFNLYVIFKSLNSPPELNFTAEQIAKINDETLPIYSILCPLYREAEILPHFVESMKQLDWPKSKLDILLLLEEDDLKTIAVAKEMNLPKYFRIITVPNSQPKTKPKACNYGLSLAKGEYLVIYDAEDKPDADQLKKSFLGFQNSDDQIVCLQAKLNYFNPHQNLLTRFFTAEYSLWFDVMLTGLQTINTAIPLGGTSNHFRTAVLKTLKGWDPFNVTEDCDLGVRLFKAGLRTAIVDSTTLEEANSRYGNWLRQRSRWLKGYMQTYLVHMRNPWQFFRQHGWHALIFQLIIGARISFMLINPVLWLMTIAYFTLYAYLGPAIERLYPSVIFYLAAFSLLVGNFSYIYNYMIGCAKRGQWNLIKFVYLIPIYWLMTSIAAIIAFYQLLVKPHYWEKTVHGLHLKKSVSSKEGETLSAIKPQPLPRNPNFILNLSQKILRRIGFGKDEQQTVGGAIWLVTGTMIANVAFFLSSTYLGRHLTLEQFGLLSLFGGILFISQVILNGYCTWIVYQTAYLLGKYGKSEARLFLAQSQIQAFVLGISFTVLWCISSIWLVNFFKTSSILPFLLFAPMWLLGFLYGVYFSGLKGLWSFASAGIILALGAISKLAISVLLVTIGREDLIILVISFPVFVEVALAFFVLRLWKNTKLNLSSFKNKFDWAFFVSAVAVGLSGINFLGLDMLLAKNSLSTEEAGQYGLLSLVGRIIFFLGTVFIPFIVPTIAKNSGEGKSNKKLLAGFVFLTLIPVLISVIGLGFFGQVTVPILYGHKTLVILEYLLPYVIAISIFTIAQPIVFYLQARKNYLIGLVSILIGITQITLAKTLNTDLDRFVYIMLAVGTLNLTLTIIVLAFDKYRLITRNNLKDLYELCFAPLRAYKYPPTNGVRILIMNWRDTKHVWSGGAETYVHELAKRWTNKGHQVTIFSGNDGHSKRHETLDEVNIIRRGGTFTVYIWAFLYYILRLRGNFDIVIDSENGIPFFTPLYVRKPKFLLIHHIHQEVFREHLKFPLSQIGIFLESVAMPLAYKNQRIITVSKSSKGEILKLGVGINESIDVIHPGVDLSKYNLRPKTPQPSFLYLGRLKPYKNIDIPINAFAKVLIKYPKATLNIAGYGESREDLEKLVKKHGIESSVKFHGRVTDEQKIQLLGEAWVFLQPSQIEGWGITVIEANACGTPVLASNVKGLRDSVVDGKTGFLIESKSTDDWSKKMIEIIDNPPLRANMSRKSLDWSKNFDWSISTQKFLTILETTHKKNVLTQNLDNLSIKTKGVME